MTKVSTDNVWKGFLQYLSLMHLGTPDHLLVDQESQFVSKELLSYYEADGISVSEAPIESPSSMSHVERYNAPLSMS